MDFLDSNVSGGPRNVVVAQDSYPFAMFIDSSLKVANIYENEKAFRSSAVLDMPDPLAAVTQIKMPGKFGESFMITGPGAVHAPDFKSVWFTSLDADGLIGRISTDKNMELFQLPHLGYS